MKRLRARNLNLLITLSSLAIVLLGCAGYYYLYTENRGERLNERHFRVLDRIGENMLALNETYLSNAEANGAQSIDELKAQVLNIANEEITRINQGRQISPVARMRIDSTYRNTKISTFPLTASVSILPNRGFKITDEGDERSFTLSFDKFSQKYQNRTQLDYELSVLSQADFQALVKQGQSVNLTPKDQDQGWEIQFTLPVQDNEQDQGGFMVSLSRSMKQFMEPILRPDVFEEFVILKRDKTSEGGKETHQVVYETFGSYFVPERISSNLDSLLTQQIEANQGAELAKFPYLVHLQPLKFNQDQLILCGLVDINTFRQEKRKISTLLVLVLLLLVMLIILGIPILKLGLISSKERMKISDLIFATSSAIFGSSLIILLLFDIYTYNIPGQQQRKQQLVDLSEEINTSFFQELEAIYDQLTYYDTLSVPHTQDVLALMSEEEKRPELFPQYYPYFSTVYWSDLSDSIGLEWSLRTQATPNVSIGGRAYLEKVKEGRAWPLSRTDQDRRFMLQSLLTRTTGDNLAVISKASEALIPQQGSLEQSPVVFLTSFLYSVIDPVLPSGFGYAVVDEAGKVWFHSDQQKNLQQNLIEETDNADLQAAIFNRSAIYLDANYMGEDFAFYMEPLDQLPLYLVTFRQKVFDRSVHEQIISLSFLLTFIVFLVGLSFVFIVILFNPSSQILKQDRFVFDWLRPYRMNRHRYQFITIANLLTLMLAALFTQNAHAPVALSVIALSLIYTFLIAFFLLNRNSRNEFLWQSHRSVVFTTLAVLLLFNFLLNAVLLQEDALQVRLFQLIPGFILLVIISRLFYRYLKRKDKRQIRPTAPADGHKIVGFMARLTNLWRRFENGLWNLPNHIERTIAKGARRLGKAGFRIGTQRSYRFFLLSWLLIIGGFPVIKFYEVAYNREHKLQIQYAQIQFSKDLESRGERIDQRYLNLPFNDSLREQLKSMGIYTQSFHQTVFTPPQPFNSTEVLIQYPVWRDTIRLPKGTLSRNSSTFLMDLRFDNCLLTFQLPVYGRHSGRELAPIFPDRPSYLIDYQAYIQNGRELVYTFTIQRKARLGTDTESDLEALYAAHQDTLTASLVVNQVLEQEFTLPPPSIQTVVRKAERDLDLEKDSYFYLDSLLSIARPRYNELIRRSNYLNRNSSADKLWSWTIQSEQIEMRGGQRKNRIQNETVRKLSFRQQDGLQLTSTLPMFEFPSIWGAHPLEGFRFWAFFVIVLVITYALINFAVYRFFAQNTLHLHAPDAVSTRKILRSTRENIFLVIPPRPLETEYFPIFEDKLSQLAGVPIEKLNFSRSDYVFDLARERELSSLQERIEAHHKGTNPLPPLLVLDNFEEDAADATISRVKFSLLNELIDSQIQVIILSTQEPLELSVAFSSAGAEAETSVPSQKQWSQSLSHFNQLYYPLEKWVVHSQQREAWSYIEQKHSFLYLAKVSYHQKELSIAGVDVQMSNGRAMMEKADNYSEFKVIRIDQSVSYPERLTKKLEKLEAWLNSHQHSQITILSTLNPQEILRTYDLAEGDFTAIKFRWKRVFDSFYKSILSVRPSNLRMKERIREIIRRECAHGKFLQSIQEELVTQLRIPGSYLSKTLIEEEIILQIGIRANLYYHALWSACSADEQLLIYDLAQDGLINSRNLKAVESLLRKGIFITDDDTIHLMNRSFRNFVLTVVDPEEALQMELEIQKDATWSRAKIPLALVIFSVAAFLFYTDINQVVDETAAFITAITALLPVISKVIAGVTGINLSFQKIIPAFRNRGGGSN